METAFLHNFPSVSFLLASAFCKRKCEIFKGLPFNFVRRATGKPPVKLFILAQSIRISELQMSLGCTQMRSCAIKDILINLLIYRHIFAACLFLKKSGGVRVLSVFTSFLLHYTTINPELRRYKTLTLRVDLNSPSNSLCVLSLKIE